MTKNKKIYTSMIIDWIAVLIFLTGILIVSKLIHPYERQFKLEDVTISHPYKGDTIKMVYLIVSIQINLNHIIIKNFILS